MPKWLIGPNLKPKLVMPNITPFLSAFHLCFVLPEQCGALLFLRNRGRVKAVGEEEILPQLYKTLLQLLGEVRKIEIVTWFESFLTT